jgi:hypothetical protein
MPANADMVLREIKNAIELNAIPKDSIKEFVKDIPAIKMAMKAGGMAILIMIPAYVLVIVLYLILKAAVKKYTKLQ